MHYFRERRALVLLAALFLLLPACSLTVKVDPELLPTDLARLPTGVAKLPTSLAELPTDLAELPTDLAELPGTVVSPDFLPGTLPPLATASPRAAGGPEDDLVAQVIQYTNEYRQQNGCGPVAEHPVLDDVAQRYAVQMAEGDFFAHEAPDGSTLAERIDAVDYRYRVVGENLAAGYSSAQAVVDNWLQSPEHRQNLLNCEFEDIGVGYYFLQQDTGREVWNHYWVQVLGAE